MPDIFSYQHDKGEYRFTTIQDVDVTVNLSLDGRWFPDNPEIPGAHSFVIKTSKPSMQLDIKLRDTILDIMVNFLRENDAIVIYYCSPQDGKGHKRHMKFSRWFTLLNDPPVEKHDRQFIVKDLKLDENGRLIRLEMEVYASILLRKTHPHYDLATRLFLSGDLDQTGKL